MVSLDRRKMLVEASRRTDVGAADGNDGTTDARKAHQVEGLVKSATTDDSTTTTAEHQEENEDMGVGGDSGERAPLTTGTRFNKMFASAAGGMTGGWGSHLCATSALEENGVNSGKGFSSFLRRMTYDDHDEGDADDQQFPVAADDIQASPVDDDEEEEMLLTTPPTAAPFVSSSPSTASPGLTSLSTASASAVNSAGQHPHLPTLKVSESLQRQHQPQQACDEVTTSLGSISTSRATSTGSSSLSSFAGNRDSIYEYSDSVTGQALTYVSRTLPSQGYGYYQRWCKRVRLRPRGDCAEGDVVLREPQEVQVPAFLDHKWQKTANHSASGVAARHYRHEICSGKPFGEAKEGANESTTPAPVVVIQSAVTLTSFLTLLMVTCATNVLSPMRDAAALAVGVKYIPHLTLASTILALGSSVPVGWLFEAPSPDPPRFGRRLLRRVGLTRGETQGSSLALFYRIYALSLLGYALGFKLVELLQADEDSITDETQTVFFIGPLLAYIRGGLSFVMRSNLGQALYVAFFLVVHLMKLHSFSLMWGVTTEAMEYEESAETRFRNAELELRKEQEQNAITNSREAVAADSRRTPWSALFGGTNGGTGSTRNVNSRGESSGKGERGKRSRARLKRLAFVGFGGTVGGLLGSIVASVATQKLRLSGMLMLAAILLELSAELTTELGRIMYRYWEEEQRINETDPYRGNAKAARSSLVSASSSDGSVDSSLKRVASTNSMKRVASGSSLSSMRKAKSTASLAAMGDGKNSQAAKQAEDRVVDSYVDENSFRQRLLRGVTTILRSRLLMAIFIYNALYATTSVLLSFQRAELVANRSSTEGTDGSSTEKDATFLARINIASNVAVFALQASGAGAWIANTCGQRGTLALMPGVRLFSVMVLAWWHLQGNGRPPSLAMFLVMDEFTKVINFAVAKPVRESLWSGLSNEARYEAKPIVDTLANRWGGGSAAFLTSMLDQIMTLTQLGEASTDGTKMLFGFPPVLILCMIAAAWWAMVSIDVGNIRRRIDLELKKQQ